MPAADTATPGPAVPAYLAGLPADQAETLAGVNAPGLAALRRYLAAGQATAFLGAGVSAPLYPLWTQTITALIDTAVTYGLPDQVAATLNSQAARQPDTVVEIIRQRVGGPRYQAVLREVFAARRDPDTGNTWTPAHELVCRCAFRAIVTTNYDPGIVNARMRVRPHCNATGFTTWTDDLGLDNWLSGDVYARDELPVLFAHGHHNQPDTIVLGTTEYRRAYTGKLPRLIARLIESGHLVWIGFSFVDPAIASILREVAEQTGTRTDPGIAPRHIAILGWDPAAGDDPATLRELAEIQYGADLILYPTPDGDHTRLRALLADLTDPRHPAPASPRPIPTITGQPQPARSATLPVEWVPVLEPVPHFTGRVEELARLDRWAGDPTVRLVGVSAWGGAGKTALVGEWVRRHTTLPTTPASTSTGIAPAASGDGVWSGVRGVFGWSFYADASTDHWAAALLEWARARLGVGVVARGGGSQVRVADAVLAVLAAVPVVLVLDGLEVAQQAPGTGEGGPGGGFGRFLDPTLREVLTGACRLEHGGLVVLTSRFPFADLEGFDGRTARMLDLPAFTPTEGATLLRRAGGRWVEQATREQLSAEVDGHALALSVMGGLLADHATTATDLARLRAEVLAAARGHARVGKLLAFYAGRLDPSARMLLAAVALFAHPITPAAVLAVAGHACFAGALTGWTEHTVTALARERLGGLVSVHPDGRLSAHPLVRDTFRPLALGAAQVAVESTLTGIPGVITTRAQGLAVVEAIELLLDADQWEAADELFRARTSNGGLWRWLPAAGLGQRAAAAFVATPTRRHACPTHLTPRRLGFYLNEVGLHAIPAGDTTTAIEYLTAATDHDRAVQDWTNLSISLLNLAECLARTGQLAAARAAATEALTHATTANRRNHQRNSHAYLGWLAWLAGDTPTAETHFTTADTIEHTDSHGDRHLISLRSVQWAEHLAGTGRTRPARTLTERNHTICTREGWNEDVACCERTLAVLDLADHRPDAALAHARAAADTFRNGDYLTELADTLPVLATAALAAGDSDSAFAAANEALELAAPRSLILAHAAALTARARTRLHHATTHPMSPAGSDQPDRDVLVGQARDDADTAHRLAARHGLAWHQHAALTVLADLDRAQGVDHGRATQAATLHTQLVPDGLDPDPLTTIERQVTADRDRQ
ncbi:MAG TPA: SIR2 family protein [Kineosporiaceae bacterium]|nr:SIR2 family protein [Kineosporiaceae bacterium]